MEDKIIFRVHHGDNEAIECFALDFDDAIEEYYKIMEAILQTDPKMHGKTVDKSVIKIPLKVKNLKNGRVKILQ